MTKFNTIPDRLPEQVLNNLKEGEYDEVILFALAVFGPHTLDKLVNNSSLSIENRMDEELFQKYVEQLIRDNNIEKYTKFGDIHYKITIKGEDYVLDKYESDPAVQGLITDFKELLGISDLSRKIEPKSISSYRITYRDFIFGLLSFVWRLDAFSEAGNEIRALDAESNITLGKRLEYNADIFADNNAILYEDVRYTYKELNEEINRYANYFLSLGVKRGEVINIFLENRPEILFMIGAMSKIGTIGSLINTKHRSATLIHSLKINPVNIYVIGEELIEPFEEVKSELRLSGKEKLFYIPDKGQMQVPTTYIDLNDATIDQDRSNPPIANEIKGKETYIFIFTSGTTGMPKAAHIRNIHTVSSIHSWGGMVLNMKQDDVIYITLPLFHSNPLHIGWSSAIKGGSAVAIGRKFSASNFWNEARKYGATCFNYIGEICRYLYNQPPKDDDRNHDVYKICGNGLQPEIWKAFKERFGIREVYEHYGMTEMMGMFCNYLNLDCTVGLNLSPHTLVKYNVEKDEIIRADDGYLQEVDEGEAGLLIVQMQHEFVFAGYTSKEANKKKLIHDAFEQGDLWYYTGDLLRNIGFKHAQFVDRLGDTFKWKGENVSTSEVEEVISSFKDVSHSSVYGVEIPGTEGKVGMASIVSTADKFEFDSFLQVLNKNLPNYAIPHFIRFLSEFSTTSTYKIQKSNLKKVGFDVNETTDNIYVLLPGSSEYTPLTKEMHDNIRNGVYPF